MSDCAPMPAGPSGVWTCPFCSLLCDDLLPEQACARAQAALVPMLTPPGMLDAQHGTQRWAPRLAGQPMSRPEALETAARWLQHSQQTVVRGLGTDVAGARSAFELVRQCHAVVDGGPGTGWAQALRVQQDRGGYGTTLAELRARADVWVMVGSWAPARLPELLRRGLAPGGPVDGDPPRPVTVVALGLPASDQTACEATPLQGGAVLHTVPAPLGLLDAVAQLNALVARRLRGADLPGADAPLRDLADRLIAARYAVLLWEPDVVDVGDAADDAWGGVGLLIERTQGLVARLNQHTRAAGMSLAPSAGAATASQVFTWRSALPLRTRYHPQGLTHDAVRFNTQTWLAQGSADLCLDIEAFDAARAAAAPPRPVRRIVLAPPQAHPSPHLVAPDTLWFPVSTPGVQRAGHLFRHDGVVVMPLHPLPVGAGGDDGGKGAWSVATTLDALTATLGTVLGTPGHPPAASLAEALT